MGLGAAHITFLDGLDATEWSIVSQWRAPRVVLGLIAGASLAVAGAGYQAVFRNPLADPYLLGAAAGAGLGATVLFVLVPAAPTWAVPVAAFAGAIVAVTIAGFGGRRRGALGLILAGIAISAFISALQTFFLITNTPRIAEVYSWLIGRLSTAGWVEPLVVLFYVLPAVGLLVAMRRRMDLFHLDDAELHSLGVNPDRTRLLVLGAATLATAAVVAAVGLIGFVGLIIPHASRRLVGGSYGRIVPVSAAMGAVFLVAADTFARTAFAPAELPVGVVTALAGAPAFVYLLNKT
jgi:iron complex transport system permease protein